MDGAPRRDGNIPPAPGGKGGIGMQGGVPTSENFLVRNRDRFAAAKFNVAVVGRPSDARGDPSEPTHWHGFIGMDQEAVEEIADFIRNPKPEPPVAPPATRERH